MIKPNESELANIDFEIQPIIAFNLILFYCFEHHLNAYISGTVHLVLMGFQCDIAPRLRHILDMKTEFYFF